MRTRFAGYYRPSKHEFAALWREATFVFDANVLLNVYRYTPRTRDELLKILEFRQDRLWIPHQTAQEYNRNRLEVIAQQSTAYDAIINELQQTINHLEASLRVYKRHAILNVDDILDDVRQPISKWPDSLQKSKSTHPDFVADDPLRDRITRIFEGRVGPPYTTEVLESLYKKAEQRYRHKIPPGYLDSPKEGPEKYGDVVVWFQMLDYARSGQHPLIFVTEDLKEDWWLRHQGKTLGPRPELVQEMLTDGTARFYIYQTDQFMLYARQYLRTATDAASLRKAVKEVQSIRQRDEALADALNEVTRQATPSPHLLAALNEVIRRATPSPDLMGALDEAIRRSMPSRTVVDAWNEAIRRAMPSPQVLVIPQQTTAIERISQDDRDVQSRDEEQKDG